MRQRRQLIVNVLSNYGAFALYGAVNIVLVGYVIRRIGADAWGVVGLVMSLTIVTELLGRGMCQALTKHLAAEIQRRNFCLANKFINTTLLWLGMCSLVGAAICGVLAMHVDRLFTVPPALVGDARGAMWLMALRVLICFPFNTFQGILWAYQRDYLVNLAKSVTVLLRLVGVVVCFEFISVGIAPLVVVIIISLMIERLMWLWYSFRVAEDLQFALSFLSHHALRILVGFGGLMLVIDVANMMGYEAIKWVIGAELSVLDTGAYVIIALLASTAGSMVRGIANALLPVASKYEALERRETNIHLALLSTRYAMIMSSGVCIAPVFLLRPFLSLLTGKEYTADYLSELAFAGAALLVGQWFITTAVCILQMLTGIGRVRFPAVVTLAWAGGGLMGVWGYLHWGEGSLLGAAVWITVARVVGCVVLLVYGIVTLQLPVRTFATEAILAPGAVGVAVGAAGWVLSTCFDLYNSREFVLAAGVLALLYVAATWWILLSSSERYEAIGKLRPIMSKLW